MIIIYVMKKLNKKCLHFRDYLDNIIGIQDSPTQRADASVKKNDADGIPGNQL